MSEPYKLLKRLPTVEEYKYICEEVGWKDYMNFDVVKDSLKHSLFGVVIQYQDEIVGMGRVVGDGYIYFYIQDIAIIPLHQSKGIGNLIMTSIIEFLKETAPEKAFVGLFSAQGKEAFYNKYGFNKHDGMSGMFGVIHEGKLM
jgi:ribosomal protein S18 acetylase RimI-like enzyme